MHFLPKFVISGANKVYIKRLAFIYLFGHGSNPRLRDYFFLKYRRLIIILRSILQNFWVFALRTPTFRAAHSRKTYILCYLNIPGNSLTSWSFASIQVGLNILGLFNPSSTKGGCNNPLQNSFHPGAQKCATKGKNYSGYV